MSDLFASGRIIDLILALVVLESLALMTLSRRRGIAVLDVAAALAPGVALMLALRAALTDAWWGWVAAWLAASLVAHLFDLSRRWGPERGAGSPRDAKPTARSLLA
ncbi:MAG TPA: hypothetical protein VIL65_10505 [Beijerinckiaceae bacterium]|jgi:hypothetical protein